MGMHPAWVFSKPLTLRLAQSSTQARAIRPNRASKIGSSENRPDHSDHPASLATPPAASGQRAERPGQAPGKFRTSTEAMLRVEWIGDTTARCCQTHVVLR